MSIPRRHSNPKNIAAGERTFFVTTSTWGKRSLRQSSRAADLFLRTLYDYRAQGKFQLHDFVVMPDHFHLLITVDAELTIEQAVQLIKGGFTFRAGKNSASKLQSGKRASRKFAWSIWKRSKISDGTSGTTLSSRAWRQRRSTAQVTSPEERARYEFMLAKIYAQRGDVEHWMHCLKLAKEGGYRDLASVYKLEEFSQVRQDARLADIVPPPATK